MLTAKSSKRVVKGKVQNKDVKSQIKSKATTSSPTTVELRGVQIHFPFKPYQCQEAYMGKVLDALNNSENALLESPTGTGKTLCLLCSTLAWQQERSRMISDQSIVGHAAGTDANVNASNTQQQQPAKSQKSTIIYASRTHSQLSQVVKELRFTRYRPKHAVLGSREQMCVHPKVKTAKATSFEINHNCTRFNKERKCRYRNNLDGFVVDTCGGDKSSKSVEGSSFEFGMQPVLDMEELIDLGKKRKVCPFYLTRGQIADAEIIFVPYNYLFDKDARSNTLADVQWENAILVFDEAHNLESFASESASFDLSSVDIAGCVNEVTRAIGYLQAMPEMGEASNVKMDNLIRLKSMFLQFEQYLDTEIAAPGGSFTGDYIFEIFTKGVNLNYSNHTIFLKFIKQVSDMVMDMRGGGSNGSSSSKSSAACPKLDHFVGCVKRVFGTATEGQSFAKARAYRVHVSAKSGNTFASGNSSSSTGGGFVGESRSGARNNKGRVLSYWCFAPSLAMHELAALNVRSILVTSGTLSPLPSYSLELGLPFPHTLENSHIIGKDQISVRVIGKGVSGKALTSTYNRRNDIDYITELGNTIISLARVIPGGVLIFFPSYGVMETCIEKWGGPLSSRSRTQSTGKKNFFNARQTRTNSASGGTGRYCFPHTALAHTQSGSTTPWQRLMAAKAIVLEPKTTSELKDVIDEFDKFLSAPKSKGCILMGVCRGKISEGIDFADEKCRAVIITGLPFAPYLDPKVKLKREYLDSAKAALTAKPSGDGGFDRGTTSSNPKSAAPIALSGAEWYSQQAHRAVNQAIGRVIRHRSDYGAILFLDSRFSEERNQQGISQWIRPSFEADNGVGGAIQALAKFFRGAKATSDANKALLEKENESDRGLQLKYEQDITPSPTDVDSAQKITKIAFINKATVDDGLLEGYVPPNRIIKHIKLDDTYISSTKSKPTIANERKIPSKSRGLASLYKSSLGPPIPKVSNVFGKDLSDTIDSAWSSRDKNIGTSQPPQRTNLSPAKEQQKQLAQQFFKLAKNTLGSNDFITVRKMLVALKDSGAKKDKVAYMKTARNLIAFLLQYDESHSSGLSKGDTLVDLLHSLLPVIYRFEIQKTACKLRFEKSAFYNLSSESMPPEDLHFLSDKFPNLMIDHEKWRDDPKCNTSDRTLFSDLRVIITMLIKNRLAMNKGLLVSMKSLLTMKMRNMATMLINELRAKQNMTSLKDRDRKRYGEEGVNKALFIKPERSLRLPKEQTEKLENADILSKTESLSRANAKNRHVSDKISHGAQSSRVRVETLKQQNPYLTKKVSPHQSNSIPSLELASNVVSARPSKRARSMMDMMKTPTKSEQKRIDETKHKKASKGLDPLEMVLQQATTEIYRKATPKVVRINKMLKSNAPTGTACNICNKTSNSFLMAECNHFSCLDCWASWLKRSQTCPTCRNATSKDSLSRVVFEAEVGAGAPSLTQIIREHEEGEVAISDGELEIL